MITVKEMSRLSGVSIRTLHHYDSIGLLKPTGTTESGYRLYDESCLERLQHILLFRELEFSLKEIETILDSPDFDRITALEQQISLLTLKKEHIENLIDLARGIKMTGVRNLDFTAFDTKKIDEYAAQAKTMWGKTEAFREFTEKNKNWSHEDQQQINLSFMELFKEFGQMQQDGMNPEDQAVQEQVKRLRNYITEHFYTCTPEILRGLADMYSGGGSMEQNIDLAAGNGTARFTAAAVRCFCRTGPSESSESAGTSESSESAGVSESAGASGSCGLSGTTAC